MKVERGGRAGAPVEESGERSPLSPSVHCGERSIATNMELSVVVDAGSKPVLGLVGAEPDDVEGEIMQAMRNFKVDMDYVLAGAKDLTRRGRLPNSTDRISGVRSSILIFGVLLLMAVLLVVAIGLLLNAYSSGWAWGASGVCSILLSGMFRMRRELTRDVLPSALVTTVSALWLLAAVGACAAALARCAWAAGTVGDFVCDSIFAALTALLLVVFLTLSRQGEDAPWSVRTRVCHSCSCLSRVCGQPPARNNQVTVSGTRVASRTTTEPTARASSKAVVAQRVCCWVLFVIVAVPLALLALLTTYHAAETLSLLSGLSDRSAVCHPGGPCLSYSCHGSMWNGSVAIVANGFAADSTSYYFLQHGMAQYTRTCTFDTRGAGLSSWPGNPPDFGFRASAADVELIVGEELRQAGVATREANVIVLAHSNGWLTAARFHSEYAAGYRRVVIANLDGQECEEEGGAASSSLEEEMQTAMGMALPAGTVQYAIAPIMPFIAGLLDLALLVFNAENFFAGQSVAGMPRQLVHLLPQQQRRALANQYSMARFWESNALIHMEWRNAYAGDGPSPAECDAAASAAGGYVEIRPGTLCLEAEGEQYCAGHLSMVQLGSFAAEAVGRVTCFLRSHLGSGGTPGPTAPMCSYTPAGCEAGGENTCRWAGDGVCDDGGPGSLFNECVLGTDCGDCTRPSETPSV